MANSTSQRDRDALLASVLALFLLTGADETAFADAIYTAHVDALDAAIAAAADAIGAGADDVQPPDDLLSQLADDSHSDAASIVETWNTDITAEAETFVDGYVAEHGGLAGCAAALKADLQGWASYRAQWKAAQIAQYASSKGYSAGLDQFVSDLLSGDLDLPDGTSLSDLVATVYPDASSSDFCADWAGNSYPIEQYGDIPSWPAHVGCIHWTQIAFAS